MKPELLMSCQVFRPLHGSCFEDLLENDSLHVKGAHGLWSPSTVHHDAEPFRLGLLNVLHN